MLPFDNFMERFIIFDEYCIDFIMHILFNYLLKATNYNTMNRQILFLAAFSIIVNYNCQSKQNDFKPEVEKWKTELLLNGEVGPPCIKDYHKWSKQNPRYYWGMQDVQSKIFDINSDGVNDGLFFFPAENCVGGNGQDSDFAILLYSHEGTFLTNKNITKTIENKIEKKFSDKGIYDLLKTNIHYKIFNKNIIGTFWTWRNDDAHCCPSLQGTFEYSPSDYKVILKYEDQLK